MEKIIVNSPQLLKVSKKSLKPLQFRSKNPARCGNESCCFSFLKRNISFEMASMAIGVSLSMSNGIGRRDDVARLSAKALKLNQKKNSQSESRNMILGMNRRLASRAKRTVSKSVLVDGEGEEKGQTNLRVGLICGGPSAERGISLNSARSVLDHIQVSSKSSNPFLNKTIFLKYILKISSLINSY